MKKILTYIDHHNNILYHYKTFIFSAKFFHSYIFYIILNILFINFKISYKNIHFLMKKLMKLYYRKVYRNYGFKKIIKTNATYAMHNKYHTNFL